MRSLKNTNKNFFRKYLILVILCLFVLSACNSPSQDPDIKPLPTDDTTTETNHYSLAIRGTEESTPQKLKGELIFSTSSPITIQTPSFEKSIIKGSDFSIEIKALSTIDFEYFEDNSSFVNLSNNFSPELGRIKQDNRYLYGRFANPEVDNLGCSADESANKENCFIKTVELNGVWIEIQCLADESNVSRCDQVFSSFTYLPQN